MQRWHPIPTARTWLSLGLALISLSGASWLLLRLTSVLAVPIEEWPIDGWLFAQAVIVLILLTLAGILLYRTIAALTLRYSIDRNGLYIQWLGSRAIIPLNQIDRVDQGALALSDWRATLNSMGYYYGQVKALDGTIIHRFTTRPLAEALVVYASNAAYAISPADPSAFVQELEQRRRLGAIQPLTPGIEVARFLVYDFWADPIIRQLLLATLVLNLLLFGAIAVIYPYLPPHLEWRGDQIGAAAELAPRVRIFFLPVAAALTALFNIVGGLIVYRRSPLAARLWQGFSPAVQIFFAIATVAVLRS